MVQFVAILDAAQDRNGIRHVGLVYDHRLEAALQCLVFLNILLVLLERGGSNGVQFAAGQRRFQQVSRVHCALPAAAGPDERMNLVDEKNNLTVGVGYFFDHGFEAFFKLALVLGTRYQQPHIQGNQGLAFQVLGHVAVHDALRQAFHDGGFTYAGFAQ